MNGFAFPTPFESEAAESLRVQVRGFLGEALKDRKPLARSDSWNGFDTDFSREIGRRGWLGMTWPRAYGGHERSAFERYVVMEEMLAAGAPVAAHWIADRQSGPALLKYGTETQKRKLLPGIAAGEIYCCIGMSEPDAGSDLAATRTEAKPITDGYLVNGTKVWTTNAHRCHYMLLFCRTSGTPADRQAGTSQLLIDLSLPGITISPIIDMVGQHHFNEVNFQDVYAPAESLVGQEGAGWEQVMSELAYERSGPERFLSSFELLVQLVRTLRGSRSSAAKLAVGRMTAHLIVLRRLSRGVTVMLETGENPSLQSAIVKDLGAQFEQELPEIARQIVEIEPDREATRDFSAVLANVIMNAPSFTLRGGTREILRGIIARGLGLR